MQLVTDPPRLRLVRSPDVAGDPPARPVAADPLRRRVALGGPARRLHRSVLTSTLATGTPVDADTLRVVLSVRQGLCPPERLTCFTTTSVWQLLFVEIVAWCRTRRLAVPPGVPTTLRTLLEHLDATGELHPDSDDIEDLLHAIDECTGGLDDPDQLGPRRSSVRSRRGSHH